MKRLVCLLTWFSVFPAAALEFHPDNLFKLIPAYFLNKHAFDHLKESDPVWRPRRVPLLDVHACAGNPNCVVLNGRRTELEAAPMDLWHQRVDVVGRARGPAYTGVFLRVRLSPWGVTDADYLLVWAAIRNKDRKVEIKGYSVDHATTPGREYQAGPEISNANMMKFLTSTHSVEVEIARELVLRQVFCVREHGDPADIIRDEVSPLQHAGLIGGEARARLNTLQTLAGVIEPSRGRLMCESPITDQVDGMLGQVREELQNYVRKAPAPTVAPRVNRADPAAPKPIAPPAPTAGAS